MDSPVRKMLKRNDYNRHKLLRKIKRRRERENEKEKHAAENQLRKKLRITPPKFKKGKNSEDDYYTYMEQLAEKKSKEWGYDSTEEALTDMLNDNTYNYRVFYNNNKALAESMLTDAPEAHFSDIGKTVYHPTFSNESIYSGKVSDYNPRGTIGGSWGGDGTFWGDYYEPSYSLFINGDFDYINTYKYLQNAEARPTFIKMPVYNNRKYER